MITLSTFIELLCTALCIGIFALVYGSIITAPGEILHPLRVLIKKVLLPRTTYCEQHDGGCEALIEPNQVIVIPKIWHAGGKTFTSYKEVKDYREIYNMVIGCEKCVAGQFALWTYLIYSISIDAGFFLGIPYIEVNASEYQVHIHLLLVSFSILSARLLSIAYSYIQRIYE